MAKSKKLQAVDLFCGAGGFTTGAEAAGVDVLLAVNHWRTAILTHQDNHPKVRHICARIDDIDPRHDKTLPAFDLLMASPECTHHSIARGGRPIDDQKRATPWHVCVWAEAKRPKWLLIENVREFRDWGPIDDRGRPIKSRKGEIFRQWIKSLEAIGYQVDHQVLNAADFGAPTKRHRLFILARRGRGRARKHIPWPEATHAGRWRAAAEVIDWSRPCPSIFARKKPLADNTLQRIEAGLRKFVEPFIVAMRNNQDGLSLREPLSTIGTSGAHHALCVPFLTKYNGHGSDAPTSPDQPLHTIVAGRDSGHVVMPYLLAVNHGGADDRSRSIDDPLATLTTKTGHSVVMPFLAKYYGTGGCQAVDEPLDTITTRDRFGLAMVSLLGTVQELGVVDIGFRMLQPAELLAAQGFPAGYHLDGNKAEQVKQIGNSVSPPMAEALCRTIVEAA